MTLPQNVADAVAYVDQVFDDCDNGEWQTIRAYLMSQDAELEMTRRVHRWNTDRCGENLMVCRDNHEKSEACDWETFVPIERAELAESRRAAANALLREAIEWNWLDGWNDEMGELDTRIQTHLQGAGDEA